MALNLARAAQVPPSLHVGAVPAPAYVILYRWRINLHAGRLPIHAVLRQYVCALISGGASDEANCIRATTAAAVQKPG